MREMKKGRILIIEDEPRIAHWVVSFFQRAGYQAESIDHGRVGLEAILANPPDLVVLDRMLPGLDGLEVLRQMRAVCNTPVILLTALDAKDQRIKGLREGADDYLCKPFAPEELVARAEAILRRVKGNTQNSLEVGPLRLDLASRLCWKKNKEISLTRIQFDLLATMMQHPGKVFRRRELLDAALSQEFDGYDRAIDVHIRRLRERIETDPSHPQLLTTVHGVGYRFQTQDDSAL